MKEKKEKYQPSNGSEGIGFISMFCDHCRRENPGETKTRKCSILTKTMVYSVTDKEYPKQWTYDDEGNPTCTAYEYHDWNKGYPKSKTVKGSRIIKGQSELF